MASSKSTYKCNIQVYRNINVVAVGDHRRVKYAPWSRSAHFACPLVMHAIVNMHLLKGFLYNDTYSGKQSGICFVRLNKNT